MNIVDGTTLIGVFKKTATPAAAETTTPAVTASTSAVTPAVVDASAPAASTVPTESTPTNATPAAAPASTFLLEEWSCPFCTYINIPARTVCEMCDSPCPTRRLASSTVSSSSAAGSDSGILARSMGLGGPNIDLSALGDVDPATAEAIRQAMMDDDDGVEGDGVAEPFNLEETLALIQENPQVKQQFATAYNLPETATIEEFRTALAANPPVMSDGPMNDDALLSLIAHNPAIQDQLSHMLSNGQPADSAALYEALQALVQRGGGEMYDEDEDEEDAGDMVDDNLEFDQDPW